jgi:hypothetical protein
MRRLKELPDPVLSGSLLGVSTKVLFEDTFEEVHWARTAFASLL